MKHLFFLLFATTFLLPINAFADTHSCTPQGADLSATSPFVLTPSQEKGYLAMYNDPYILGLKKDLRAWHNHTSDSTSTKNLRRLQYPVAHSPFVVLWMNPDSFGGNFVEVLYPKNLSHTYLFLVYMQQHQPVIYSAKSTACTQDEQYWLSHRYARVFNLGNDQTLSR